MLSAVSAKLEWALFKKQEKPIWTYKRKKTLYAFMYLANAFIHFVSKCIH